MNKILTNRPELCALTANYQSRAVERERGVEDKDKSSDQLCLQELSEGREGPSCSDTALKVGPPSGNKG